MEQLRMFPKGPKWEKKHKRVHISATLKDQNFNFYISVHWADELLKELHQNGYKNIVQN
jgi:hypothetical protein